MALRGDAQHRFPLSPHPMNVQHWLAQEVTPGAPLCSYETVTCKACTRIHFVNRLTGKLPGE
jgi:hypothetical protein